MTDRQRWSSTALGAIALMIAGIDELLERASAQSLWIAVMVARGLAIFNTWREAQSIWSRRWRRRHRFGALSRAQSLLRVSHP